MGLERRFEGRDLLSELLSVAGSEYTVEEVAEAMAAARQSGQEAGEFIPSLFDQEPRFPDPELARRLYANLLGLWDLSAAGPAKLEPPVAPKRTRPKKSPLPEKPAPFGIEGPDEEFVDRAWRYLDALKGLERQRLEHSFENRQDALLTELDGEGLTDEGYAFARHLLFELFAMIELGWPPESKQVAPGVPAALVAYSEDALSEAELEGSKKVRDAVMRGLAQLWNGGRRRR